MTQSKLDTRCRNGPARLPSGELLRDARIRVGIRPAQLARYLDVSPGHVRSLENGWRRPTDVLQAQIEQLLSTPALIVRCRQLPAREPRPDRDVPSVRSRPVPVHA